jgi:hypothetical protein
MPLYDFRLRFNLADGYRIGSDVAEIELLVLPSGERIRMISGDAETPLKNCTQVAVLGKSFASENQARDAAEKSKHALLYWAIEQRLGIDFGGRKQRSMATNAYLAMLEKQHGHPFRNDIHGIDVYEHVEKLKFVSVTGKATVGKHSLRLIETFQREYVNSRQLTEKEVLASEIYASSFFDVSARSRFITLVTAVEALLERPKRSDVVEELAEQFKAKAQLADIDEQTKKSITGSLQDLKRESITQAGRTLVGRLIPNELWGRMAIVDTKSFMLPPARRSISVHKLQVVRIPV